MFKRRLVCIVIIAGLLLGLTGCGDSGEDNSSSVSVESVYEYVMSEDSVSYIYRNDPSFKGVDGVDDYYSNGEYIYFCRSDEYNNVSLCRIDKNGTFEKLADINTSETEYVEMLVRSVDERVGVIISDDYNFKLLEYDGNGLADKGDITSIVASKKNILLELYHVSDGYVAVTDNSIIKYDENLKEQSSVSSQIGCSCLDKNGNVVVAHNEVSARTTSQYEVTNILSVYDVSSGKIENKFQTRSGDMSDLCTGVGDYDVFICSSDIYGLNYSEKTEAKLVSLNDSGIVSADYGGFSMLDDQTMIASRINYDDYSAVDPTTSLIFEKFVPDSQMASATEALAAEQNEVTLAVLNGAYVNTDIKHMVNAYNEADRGYRIKMIEYSGSGYSDGATALGNDIANGNTPDIYDVSMNTVGNMSLDQAVSKGLLEDVTPYLEADRDIEINDFIPSVFNTMKIDGGVYFLSPDFNVMCICTKEKNIGEGYGWTPAEWEEYVMSKPSNYAISSESKSEFIFNSYMSDILSDYVDWKTGGCFFESNDFKSILKTCNRGKTADGANSDEIIDWLGEKISKDEFLMCQLPLSDASAYVWRKDKIGDMGIKGFPTSSGSGIIAEYGLQIAMSSSSEKKEAVWDFMKFCMSKEVYDEGLISKLMLPVREDAYEEFEKKLKTGMEEDEIGIPVRPLTDKEISEYRDIIDNIGMREAYDINIMDIIRVEALPYFKGEKTVDEVCAAIQKKVYMYVNEN